MTVVERFLNPKPVIDEIEHFLKNKTLMEKENEIVEISLGDPLINDKGLPLFLHTIKAHINEAVVQGYHKKDELNYILKELNIDLIQLISTNWKEFQIKKEHFDLITDNIDHLAQSFLSRTLDDTERKRFMMPSFPIKDPEVNNENKAI